MSHEATRRNLNFYSFSFLQLLNLFFHLSKTAFKLYENKEVAESKIFLFCFPHLGLTIKETRNK